MEVRDRGTQGRRNERSRVQKILNLAMSIITVRRRKGHWKTNCPIRKGNSSRKNQVLLPEDETNSEEDIALVADEHTHHTDVWVLDSGASYHICPRREWFTTYDQVDGGILSMANSAVCRVVGIGSVGLRNHDGQFCTLNNVRHVPHMTKNLISLSLLDTNGFSFQGEGGVLYVCKGSKRVLNQAWYIVFPARVYAIRFCRCCICRSSKGEYDSAMAHETWSYE